MHYDWLRSPDEYMNNYMALMSLDPGTTYQVRVVAKNGDGFEAAAVWQEFTTPGVGESKRSSVKLCVSIIKNLLIIPSIY